MHILFEIFFLTSYKLDLLLLHLWLNSCFILIHLEWGWTKTESLNFCCLSYSFWCNFSSVVSIIIFFHQPGEISSFLTRLAKNQFCWAILWWNFSFVVHKHGFHQACKEFGKLHNFKNFIDFHSLPQQWGGHSNFITNQASCISNQDAPSKHWPNQEGFWGWHIQSTVCKTHVWSNNPRDGNIISLTIKHSFTAHQRILQPTKISCNQQWE